MPTSNAVRWNGLTPSNAATALTTANMVPLSNGDGTVTWTDAASIGGGVSTAVILAPATSARNVVTSTSNTAVELTLTAKSGQTANLFEAYTSAAVQLVTLNRIASGYTLTVNAFSGGVAILGQHIVGTGTGVNGAVDDGTGVLGTVANVAASSSSVAVKATANGSATGSYAESSGGISGKFRSSDAGNTAATVVIQQKGSSTAHLASFLSNAGAEMSYVDSVGTYVGPVTALKSATTSVSVSAATAPSIGQVLTATSSTTATWQNSAAFSPNYASVWHNGGVTFYGTLGGAKAVAVSGDEIEVHPGTFNENNLLVNGVNWYFHPGAKVTYTGGGTATCAIFDDGTNGANTAVTCVIGGEGQFTNTSGDIPCVLHVENGSQISLNADLCAGTNRTIDITNSGNTAVVYVKSAKITETSGSYSAIYYSGGKVLDITAELIASTTNYGTGILVAANSPSKLDVRANRISARGICVYQTGTATTGILVSGEIISEDRAVMLSDGSVTIRASAILCTTDDEHALYVNGGDHTVDVPLISTVGATHNGMYISGGTLRLANARVKNTGASGVAGQVAGGTFITMGTNAFISDSGATDSLLCASAVNITNLGTLCGNKALNQSGGGAVLVNATTFFSDANVV